jgi:hypothetical protein
LWTILSLGWRAGGGALLRFSKAISRTVNDVGARRRLDSRAREFYAKSAGSRRRAGALDVNAKCDGSAN